MTRALLAFAVAIAAIGCSSSRSVDHQTFGALAFAMPTDWVKGPDLSDVYTQHVQYTPSANEAKQSIVITHTSPRRADLEAGPPHVEKLLEVAQRNLNNGRFGKPTRFRNELGMTGVKIEGSFTPPGKTDVYQRLHAVLFDNQQKSYIVPRASLMIG